ncbi:hypothetical protein MHBO_001853 [Bonamia ostreae]|uniref:RRM domain-containing protein n=1 Tax=Bonamia ostreae TaxID=126728 RepID=A0ABV2AL65_9EUKA
MDDAALKEFEKEIENIEYETELKKREKPSIKNAIFSRKPTTISSTKPISQENKISEKVSKNAFKIENAVFDVQSLPKRMVKHEELVKKDKRFKKMLKEGGTLKSLRSACGKVWKDETISDWPEDDYRLFCGNLGNEVTDDTLKSAFNKYPSFCKARVIREKRTNKSKGYGFVSFLNSADYTKAFREMNRKFVGNRPIKLQKSKWRNRQVIK